MSAKQKALHDIPSDSLLHRQLCEHVSFKSLPTLGTNDSLEEIKKLRRYSGYPRRNLLCSFVQATTYEKKSRRKLNQNKINDKNNQDLLKISSPGLGIYKLRHKFPKEKFFINFNIRKLCKKFKNHFKKEIFESGSFQINLEKGKLTETKCNLKLKFDQINKETDSNIIQAFKKLNLEEGKSKSQPHFDLEIKPGKMEMSENSLTESESTLESQGLKYETFLESEKPMESSSNMETLYTQRQLDFSSGDDAKNCPSFQSNENCQSENLIAEQSQISRRSVQWNGEVDVVYYAGDADGGKSNLHFLPFLRNPVLKYSLAGKIVGREREPLREEADQQARHKRFIELVVRKNLLSNVRESYFRDSWLVVFPK